MASQTSFQLLWQEAIKEFNRKSETSADQVWLPELKQITLEGLLERIKKQNENFKEFSRPGKCIRETIATVLKPVRMFSDIAVAGVAIVSCWLKISHVKALNRADG